MIALVFLLPLIAALACLVLDRLVATRALGLAVACALAVAASALLVAMLRGGLPATALDYGWLALERRAIRLVVRLDAAAGALALLPLGGGAAAALALALALPAGLRRFGGLFAALALTLLAAAAGLALDEPLLKPLAVMLVAVLGGVTLRASGALAGSDAPLIIGLSGSLAALLLLASLGVADAGVPGPVTLLCVGLAGMILLGAAPFQGVAGATSAAPAALGGAVLALGLLPLGGDMLVRFAAAHEELLPRQWHVGLAIVGTLTLLACAAGALGATHARRLLAWQLGAQAGVLLVAIAQGGATLAFAAPALLVNAALTTLAGSLGVATLERRAGTDELSAIRDGLAPLPGLALLLAGASAAGMPGTWGLWGRLWLLDELQQSMPWAIPPLLAGSALLAAGYVAPLAAMARHDRAAAHQPVDATAAQVLPLLAALPLVLLGIAPQAAWRGWLGASQQALTPGTLLPPPRLPGGWELAACAVAAALLVLLPFVRSARRQYAESERYGAGAALASALGEQLGGLAWLGAPTAALNIIWEGLLRLSQGLARLLSRFEQRYYLAGLLIALIAVILIFI